MAKLKKPINSNDQDDSNDYSPLPAGWYDVEIEQAELRQSNSGDYDAVNVTFLVVGPTHAGRLLWNWFNYSSDIPENQRDDKMKKAIQIGRSELNRMCRAVGLNGELEDTDDLTGKILKVKVAIDKKDSEKNAVKGYKPSDGAATQGPSSRKTDTGKPPWM